ncbi:MAG: DUF1611 domain-containing protein [Pseudonocardia sp.]|nr:DUF1611 domain-containing protein [Pseudonocardia sp.]
MNRLGAAGGRPAAAVATCGRLAELDAKMAHGILRYCDHVVAVVDPRHAGGRLREIVPYAECDVPVVAGLDDLPPGVEEIVVGAAPPGGAGDGAVLETVRDALGRGLWVVHGLHTTFADHPDLADALDRLVELRHVPLPDIVARGRCAELPGDRILTVASDCASGKMTTALELWSGLRRRGKDAAFVATGQTGMYISGAGFPLDAVRADFAAGVVESYVLDHTDHDYTVVEGQGAITHPAYSGVSLALLHGAAPNKLVFCHDVGRSVLEYFDRSIEDLAGQIALTERLAGVLRPATTVAVVAMSRGLDTAGARAARQELSRVLSLPVFDATEATDGLVEAITR